MPARVRGLKDHGTFVDYTPDPARLPVGYRDRVALLQFARDEAGEDFYQAVYGWNGAGYAPITGRTFAYIEDATKRVTQIVHDDEDAFPPHRTMLSHPVRDGVSLRLVTFAANRAIVPGMVWDGKDGFAE